MDSYWGLEFNIYGWMSMSLHGVPPVGRRGSYRTNICAS